MGFRRGCVISYELTRKDWDRILNSRLTKGQYRLALVIEERGTVTTTMIRRLHHKTASYIFDDPIGLSQRLNLMGLPYRVKKLPSRFHRYDGRAEWTMVRVKIPRTRIRQTDRRIHENLVSRR